jgi:succinyl-CoA synthetase alpha subunit
MTVLINETTKVIVQGATGREGTTHTLSMLKYGTNIVAGVTPGKSGDKVGQVPVYSSVRKALDTHPEANASRVFVPAPYLADAVYEAIDSGLKLIVAITEHVPVHDSLRFVNYARDRGITIIGPNCPGLISPGECKVGIMPGHIFSKGNIGMVSRSGTLTYEIAWVLSRAGLGQSTAVGIGGDPVIGTDMLEVVGMFENDPETRAIVVIGEIGGDAEENLAQRIRAKGLKKPMVSFIAGRQAPPGKRMGHAGAIVSMGAGTARSKIDALESVGVKVAELPSQIPSLLRADL